MHRDPNTVQVGGNHYTQLAHQPDHLTLSYDLNGFEHSVVKYFTRWQAKDGLRDLRKGRHYIEKLQHDQERIIQTRQNYPALMPTLLVSDYVKENKLDPRESMVVVYICRWRMTKEPKHLGACLECALDLIHDAKKQGWET